MKRLLILIVALTFGEASQAQTSRDPKAESREPSAESREPRAESPEPKPIQDNSFLLEEAYNQEAGVIQHISSVVFDRNINTWLYSLTDEWPVVSQRHQLSLTIPIQNSTIGKSAALGDLLLNYRLQLVGSGETRLAVTPRLTLLIPTAADELGGGASGLQGALASSFAATPTLLLHTNAAITVRKMSGASQRLTDFSAGQSAIWLVHHRVNLMLEGVVANVEEFTATGTGRSTGFTLSPGLRWSHDFESGLQVVPGVAFPLGFRANKDQRGVLVYLSFEHVMPGLPR